MNITVILAGLLAISVAGGYALYQRGKRADDRAESFGSLLKLEQAKIGEYRQQRDDLNKALAERDRRITKLNTRLRTALGDLSEINNDACLDAAVPADVDRLFVPDATAEPASAPPSP